MCNSFSPCIVIPTYNNVSTICQVVNDALTYNIPVIVVNDGCTDGTAEALATITSPLLHIVVHPTNRGKGEGLKSAFAKGLEIGCTNAITIDADGQHDPAQIAGFLTAAQEHPDHIIIGERDLSGPEKRRKKSRLLRANSNFWVFMETGKWISDTQTGFRCYPLKEVCSINLPTGKYDFEVEVLVKFLWRGGEATSVPVTATYGAGSSSHFRPLQDFLLVTHCNIGLCFQAFFLPKKLLATIHSKGQLSGGYLSRLGGALKQLLLVDFSSPFSFAAACGLGVFCGIIPLWGFQMLIAVAMAHLFRLSKGVTLLASNISVPPMIPFILYFSLLTGRFVLNETMDYGLKVTDLTINYVWSFTKEYLIGSMLFALIMGLITALVAGTLSTILHPKKINAGE